MKQGGSLLELSKQDPEDAGACHGLCASRNWNRARCFLILLLLRWRILRWYLKRFHSTIAHYLISTAFMALGFFFAVGLSSRTDRDDRVHFFISLVYIYYNQHFFCILLVRFASQEFLLSSLMVEMSRRARRRRMGGGGDEDATDIFRDCVSSSRAWKEREREKHKLRRRVGAVS